MKRTMALSLALALAACGSGVPQGSPLWSLDHTWDRPIPEMRIVWTVTESPCAAISGRSLRTVSDQCARGDRDRPVALAIIEQPGVCHVIAPAPRSGDDRMRVDMLRHELAHCIPGNFNWHP